MPKPITSAILSSAVFVNMAGCEQASDHACGIQLGVSDVYPSSELLPVNLLRFYIYFDVPQTSNAPTFFVRDSDGKAVEGLFLENRFLLWSPDKTRLTLLLDPGRIKSGLEASETLGTAMKLGHSYELMFRADTSNKSCAATTLKRFQIGGVDDRPPRPNEWSINKPNAGTQESLSITLDGLYDHLSLAYRIRILSGDKVVRGAVDLAENETVWQFTPSYPWASGVHVISIDPLLEDVAGNRFVGIMDDPTGQTRSNMDAADPLQIEFTPIQPS